MPQMLLIAGTGRNTGKTTLACGIIRKFGSICSIIALKITPHFHKNVESGKVIISSENLYIAEEPDAWTGKDSSLMLQAGALKSYFVMVADACLDEALQAIIPLIPPGSLVVCESGGLRSRIVPGLFFMMSTPGSDAVKQASEKLKLLADRLITFDGEKIDFDLNAIEITGNQWKLIQ